MHLILEHLLSPCFCTTNALLYEALWDTGFLDMQKQLTTHDSELTTHDSEYIVEKLGRYVSIALSELVGERYKSCKAVAFAVSGGCEYGGFGSFSTEFMDLVRIAEVRRRYKGQHYMSKYHILWAVSFTVFKDSVDQLFDGLRLKKPVEKEFATCPAYYMYMSALTIANMLGDELVRIEHLVVAIVYEVYQRSLKDEADVSPALFENEIAWDEFKRMECVGEFLNAVKNLNMMHEGKLIQLPTGIVQCPEPQWGKIMDLLRGVERKMKCGQHEFAKIR